MDLYEKNLNFFKDRSIIIYECIQSEESRVNSNVTVIDPEIIKVDFDDRTCYIHSLYDIQRETLKMFSKVDPDIGTLVLFGGGLWHCIDNLISTFKNLEHIIVIEPDLNLFKVLLNIIDMESIINKGKKITFLVNRQQHNVIDILWDLLSANTSVKMEFVFNLSYRSLYSSYYDNIYQGITKMIKNCLINTATSNTFLYQWAVNTIRNSRHNALPLTKMIDRFKGLSIIIVSAGPSLNYNMQYLKEVKKKAVVLAVGSAIKVLDSNGIVPHFRMALDPNEDNNLIFNDIDSKAAALIFSDRLYHEIIDHYKGNKIRMLIDTDYIGQYIYPKLYNEKFMIPSGFSVANVALDAAIKLGFAKIILIGQDLCYTEGSLYAKGSWTEDTIDIKDSKYIQVKNSLGETVFTDPCFLGMKDLLEHSIRLNPNRTYINATESGLNITGTINKPISKVIDDDLHETVNIDDLIKDTFDQELEEDLVWKQKLVQLNLEDHIKELYDLNEFRLKKLKKIKKYLDNGIGVNKLQSELRYVDDTITHQIENNEFYKISVKPSLNFKIYALRIKYQDTDKDEFKIIENRVARLLGEITDLKQYLDVLKSIVLNLEDI